MTHSAPNTKWKYRPAKKKKNNRLKNVIILEPTGIKIYDKDGVLRARVGRW